MHRRAGSILQADLPRPSLELFEMDARVACSPVLIAFGLQVLPADSVGRACFIGSLAPLPGSTAISKELGASAARDSAEWDCIIHAYALGGIGCIA